VIVRRFRPDRARATRASCHHRGVGRPRKPKVDKSGRTSAGVLLWRTRRGLLEVLLGLPGGPYFAGKDAGAWTVLKGEVEPGEEMLDVARREFAEETGSPAPGGPVRELGEIRQKSGKRVLAWAIEGDLDPIAASSNTFVMEWPPRSGHLREFPEIDRVAWFDLTKARTRIKAAQVPFLDRLGHALGLEAGSSAGSDGG
jgi:predicted NUDIX family NTP pyrophosphohydrolase